MDFRLFLVIIFSDIYHLLSAKPTTRRAKVYVTELPSNQDGGSTHMILILVIIVVILLAIIAIAVAVLIFVRIRADDTTNVNKEDKDKDKDSDSATRVSSIETIDSHTGAVIHPRSPIVQKPKAPQKTIAPQKAKSSRKK